jgi:hypothetical protein
MPSRVVFTDCDFEKGGPAVARPQTPIEQLKEWCESEWETAFVGTTPERELLLARVRSQARALRAMCSPVLVQTPEGGWRLVLNPWREQPLLWEGD